MKILLADDTTIERVLAEKMLQSMGHQVVSASDGEEALKKFEDEAFHIVLLDWMMPKMDGIEACKRIRALDPLNTEYCYIIMVTSKSKKENYLEALGAGVDEFIQKPVDKNELSLRLRAGERILNFNRKLFEKNKELTALQTEMNHYNTGLKTQVNELKTRLKEKAAPEGTLATPYNALKFGEVHLVECAEGDESRAYKMFLDDVTHGVPGLVLSRAHPSKVKEKYKLVNTEVIWITKGLTKGQDGSYLPLNILAIEEETPSGETYNKNLRVVYEIIQEFVQTKGKCAVLLDGIEYMFSRFSNTDTMDMLYDLSDMVKRSEGKVVMTYYPGTIEQTTASILKKEMNWIPAK